MLPDQYPSYEFRSIDELCELIDRETASWDTRWYRGSKTPQYKLVPKLFRDAKTAAREGYLAIEFRRRARPYLTNLTSPFDWLCGMQHYGIPTRLLDWSESLAVALYFTTRPLGIDLVAPTIWVLDPFRLNALSSGNGNSIPLSTEPHVLANADISFDEFELAKERTQLPVPVVPDFVFNRLANQNGTFTIHGTDTRPLDELIPIDHRDMLVKFVARADACNKILQLPRSN
jgi:hypothetical protein